MELSGNYNLEIEIAGNQLPISPAAIEELTISQDIDRMVPTFTLRLKDATNLLGIIIPFDKQSSDFRLTLSRASHYDDRNIFELATKKRRVLSNRTVEMTGILKTEGLFSPFRNRALAGNIRNNLLNVIEDEIPTIFDTEIGTSLSLTKTVLQPYWTNAYLFRYLKNRILGAGGEACYYCFIKNTFGKQKLVFKSINELFLGPTTYKFIIGANSFEDFRPVSEYRIFDNSQFRAFFSAKTANYNYFDYDTGTYTSSKELTINDYPALSEYHLVDEDDDTEMSVSFLGRKNDFSGDFKGRVGQTFYDALTKSIYMWISTWGIENIAPGDMTKVIFSEALSRGNLFIYQPSGIWMIKRVVHVVGSSFLTNLLLVRSGIDTDVDTTLLPSTEVRKK